MLLKEVIILEESWLCEGCIIYSLKETESEGNAVHYGEPESEFVLVLPGVR